VSGPERRAAALAEAVARTLLLLYPGGFRRAAGDELVRDFRLRAAEPARRGARLRAGLWLCRATLSLLANAPGAWRERSETGTEPLGALGREVRVAARRLVRAPGFTLVVESASPDAGRVRRSRPFRGRGDGTFELDELSPGTWRIAAWTATAFAEPVEGVRVAAGRTTSGIEIVLRPGGTIRVRVREPDGRPAAGARVSCVREERTLARSAGHGSAGTDGEWVSSPGATGSSRGGTGSPRGRTT